MLLMSSASNKFRPAEKGIVFRICIGALLVLACSGFAFAGGGGKPSPEPGSIAEMMPDPFALTKATALSGIKQPKLTLYRKGVSPAPSNPPVTLKITAVGKPDDYEQFITSIKTDGVLPLGEYVMRETHRVATQSADSSESCRYGVCRLNAVPKDCGRRMLVAPFPRESMLRRFNPFPDTIWLFNRDIVKSIFAGMVGTEVLTKQDTFFAFRMLMGEKALFSTDSGAGHAERRQGFKQNLGGNNALLSIMPVLSGAADKFIDSWAGFSDSVADDIGPVAVNYISPAIINSVFGIDVTEDEEFFKKLVSHLSGIIPLFTVINNDPAFYLSYKYRIPKGPKEYLEEHYPLLATKGREILADVHEMIKEN